MEPSIADAQAYEYSLLEESPGMGQQIRLLTLHPGPSGEHIRCTLKPVSLDSQPSFEALSYTWGDPKGQYCTLPCEGDLLKMYPIEIDGKRFEVGYNLHSALRQLRKVADPRILWVDAICINQKDDEEKSRQVRAMTSIYSSAVSVLAWLGEKDKFVDTAYDILEEVCWAKRAKMWKYCSWKLQKPWGNVSLDDFLAFIQEGSFNDPREFPNPFMGVRLDDGLRPDFVEAVSPTSAYSLTSVEDLDSAAVERFGQNRHLARSLVACPVDSIREHLSGEEEHAILMTFDARNYWRRLWIVQELVLARKIQLLCGDRQLDAEAFVILHLIALSVERQSGQASIQPSHGVRTGCLSPLIFRALTLMNARSLYNGSESRMPIYYWLEFCSIYYCTDPRDRVYALLGISKPNSIVIDYTLSTEAAFALAAKCIMKQQNSLDLIFRRPAAEQPLNNDFPSWLPRFDLQSLSPGAQSMTGLQMFCCGGLLDANWDKDIGTLLSLHVEGYVCTRLAKVCHVWNGSRVDWNGVQTLALCIQFRQSSEESESVNVESLPAPELSCLVDPNFWRTIFTDMYRDDTYRVSRISTDEELSSALQCDINTALQSEPPHRLMEQLRMRLANKAFCLTEDGDMVLTHHSAQAGDFVMLAKGASMPLIIRDGNEPGECIFIGPAYINDYMDGRPMELLTQREVPRHRLVLT